MARRAFDVIDVTEIAVACRYFLPPSLRS